VGSGESVSNRLEHNKSRRTIELATRGIARRKRHIPKPSGGAIATYQVQLKRTMKSRKSRPKTLAKVDLMRRPSERSTKPIAKRRRGKPNERRRRCKLNEKRKRSKRKERRRRERLQLRQSEGQSYKQSNSVENVTGQNMINQKKRERIRKENMAFVSKRGNGMSATPNSLGRMHGRRSE
jgi:hypothetical protein